MGFRYATGRLYKPKGVAFDDLELSYTGAVQTATLPAGTYRFELWGAEGGDIGANVWPGKGGYAKGEVTLAVSTLVSVYVGGQGGTQVGGWNGGGNAGSSTTTSSAGGGGTDIRIGGTALINRVLVAGAGGGTGNSSLRFGGDGGGTTGGAAGAITVGTGGTQSGGGVTDGAFGQGGNADTGALPTIGGGGGGGWYGGGYSTVNRGGGGGSSYIGGSVTTEGETFPLVAIANGSTTAGQREGNGLAQIFKIG